MRVSLKYMILKLAVVGLYTANLLAADVTLPAQSKRICIGKSAKLIQLSVQANYWKVDGKTSKKSTFSYSGTNSKLTLDTDEADVVAKCIQEGTDTYALEYKLNFSDPNVYSLNYSVQCVRCSNEAKVKKVQDHGKAVVDAARKGKVELARKLEKLLRQDIDRLLNDEQTTAEARERATTLLEKIDELLKTDPKSEDFERLMREILELLNSLE